MRTLLASIDITTRRQQRGLLVLLIGFLFSPVLLNAQGDTTQAAATDTTAVTAPAAEEAAAPEMISPSISLSGIQQSDNSITINAALKAKVNGQFYQLYRMKLEAFAVKGEEEISLGHVITNGMGKAVFNIKNDSLPADTEGKLNFKVVFAGNKMMDAAEEVLSFKKAKLEITPVKEDSLMSVRVKLVDGEGNPVKDATVGIFVKRLIQPQKLGEATTDENGEAVVEFPAGIPGDEKGNLTIIGRVDENETFGNLEASSVQPWGVAVSNKPVEQPRALWSSHPPLWMLITFIILMAAVWGHYIVIVYELFRLRKEEPHTAANKE